MISRVISKMQLAFVFECFLKGNKHRHRDRSGILSFFLYSFIGGVVDMTFKAGLIIGIMIGAAIGVLSSYIGNRITDSNKENKY